MQPWQDLSICLLLCLLDHPDFSESVMALECLSPHTVQSRSSSMVFWAQRGNAIVLCAHSRAGSGSLVMNLGWGIPVTQVPANEAPKCRHP